MQRLVAILLMPFFVVGNSFAHSHGTVAHQSNGQGRAHIHIGSGSHHGHHHHDSQEHCHHDQHSGHKHESDSESATLNPVNHDADAIYIVAADAVCKASDRSLIEVGADAVVATTDEYLSAVRSSVRERPPRLAIPPGLPLYLLNAALRL